MITETGAGLVDLDRYPLGDLLSKPAIELIEGARQQLAAKGYAELEGFITPDGVVELVADAESLQGLAHKSGGLGTAYLHLPDGSHAAEHPMEWVGPYPVGAVPYDVFPYDSPLRHLYEAEPVMRLIEAIAGRGRIYPYADPFGALNLAVMEEGDELQWHFDQADFVVSIAIRSPEGGGHLDVSPLVRNPSDERFEEVAAVLAGDRSSVETVAMRPGTLLVFEGRYSLHRVSPIEGPVTRLVGLLAYDTKPGTVGTELLRLVRYGRSEPFAVPPASKVLSP